MLRVCAIFWFLFVGVLAGAGFAKGSSIKEDIALVRICNVTDPVDLGVFNEYMMHHDFESVGSHARDLSCFLLCIYNHYKWMDRHGNFRPHKIKSWMHGANLTLNDREILLHKCITIDELADPCSRARHFTECFWSNHQGTGSSENEKRTLHAIIKKKDTL